MKIGIFSDHFYPELGGIQDSLEELARELSSRGHEIHIWAARPSKKDFTYVHREPSEIELGDTVHVHRVPSIPFLLSPTKQSRIAAPFFLPARDAVKACDVLHTNSFFGIGLTALYAARKYKKPIVGTNHWAFAEFGDYLPSPIAGQFSTWAIRYVNWYFGKCDYMTAPGISTIEEEVRDGFSVEHEAISNPIDTDSFYPATHDERSRLREKFGFTGTIILCVGRLAVEKKNDIVLRAFGIVAKEMPTVTLVFAGHGTFEKKLRALAKELDVSERVRFFGTLHKQDLADCMRAADIYAIASTSETQSMSLLQAFACGLPAIGVQWRAIPEYLSEERGMLFPKDDPVTMAEKMKTLVTHEDLRNKMGIAANAYAQKYSIKPVVDRWEEIYARAIRNYRS